MVDVAVEALGASPGHRLQGPTPCHRFTLRGELRDGSPLELVLTDVGAAVCRVRCADRDGRVDDVVLDVDHADRVVPGGHPYLGVTVGRWANRLGGARVVVDGAEVVLDANEGPNQLHGGSLGWSWFVWDHELLDDGVRFTRTSPAGEMGFPGTVEAAVTVRIDADGIDIGHEATSDAPTVVSMTNHAYWNLGGPGAATVADHVVTVDADRWVPVDAAALPLDGPLPVDATPFDLRGGAPCGDLFALAHPATAPAPAGIDHCLLVAGTGLRRHARLDHPASGRAVEVWSDQPGVQVYAGGHLPDRPAAHGWRLRPHAGWCLEPGLPPDAPNRPWAPPSILRPGERYRHRCRIVLERGAGD